MGRITSAERDLAISMAVKSSRSVAGVLRLLKMRVGGGNYSTIQRAIRDLTLDTSHWTGQGHRKGSRVPVVPARPLASLLVRGSTYPSSSKLRIRLIRERLLIAECSDCGLSAWRGASIPLELDHRDGDRTNNELSNLRLLCPNCHAMTPTYRGRNIKRTSRNITLKPEW